MNKIPAILVIFLSLFVLTSFGQITEKIYPEDAELKKCLELNSSTTGRVACTGKAERAWDAALNKYYKLLLAELDAPGQQALREAQRSWLMYKEKETKLYRSLYAGNEGTMWNVIIADRQMNITRQRALELKDYYEMLTQH